MRLKDKRSCGFTLAEIMVALCIAAIFTAIAMPGFKKTMQDLKLNEFVCNFEGLIKAFRSYYLIFNEWPPDGGSNTIPAGNIRCFLQHHLYKENQFIYRPLRKSGASFDFENWINGNVRSDDGVVLPIAINARMGNMQDVRLCFNGLADLDGFKGNVYYHSSTCVAYRFSEAAHKDCTENRYY
ncbi:MAG: prepilin-type N-terminal cleavage/methylation domain-containing protein [Puniceicoccales bacterium]|jgi:prepilin-type N-terminal cleavage/methylation domain-containing protein|nr:prepilin-type N-terminal cleavage/methylation domain-containing protein [Puniceicoccales bacterium]